MDGVKVDSLNTVEAMIITKSIFFKDFDKCVTWYKDFHGKYNSTPSKKRRVSEVSSSGRGGSGVKKAKDR